MNKIVTLAVAPAVLVFMACESTAEPIVDCIEDPMGVGCVPAAVGAMHQVSPTEVRLVDLNGTRLVTWNPTAGTFSAAQDVVQGTPPHPLSQIGAWSSTRDGARSYFFDNIGTSYTVLDNAAGTYDPVGTFPGGVEWNSPALADVGALVQAANTDRIFFFDQAGTSFQLWDYTANTWNAAADFNANFGGGGSPVTSVGAAVLIDSVYHLFDISGTMWATYDQDAFTFDGPFSIGDLGDGTLNFN